MAAIVMMAQVLMQFLCHAYHGSTIGRLTLTVLIFGHKLFV